MPISFPPFPDDNDVHTSAGRSWTYDAATGSWIGGLSMAVGTLAAQNANAVAIGGGTITGLSGLTTANATVTGNLVVDTNTLFVDSSNDRVGIGTASPTAKLDVNGSFNAAGNATIGGTLGVTGQVELSASQAATNPTSAMTRALGDARYGERILSIVETTQTVTNSTAYADVTSTEKTLSAGTWHIEARIMTDAASATPGIKARIFISGAAIKATGKTYISGFSAFTSQATQSPLILLSSAIANIDDAAVTFRAVEWSGIIVLPTSRTLKMQIAQKTLSNDAVSIWEGSHFIATKL